MTNPEKLITAILQSPLLETCDIAEVKSLAFRVSLVAINVVVDVNTAMKDQVELECLMTYLRNKYNSRLNYSNDARDRVFGRLAKDLGPRSPLIKNDPDYVSAMDRCRACELLYSNLKGLSDVVNGRQDKLEQLSINYRLELRSDG